MNESVAGISGTLSDSGAELARAQDKIAQMQARAGALDELLQSGVLEDVGGNTDDIQKELDQLAQTPTWTVSWPRSRHSRSGGAARRPS